MNNGQIGQNKDHNLFNQLFQDYSEKIYRLAGKFFPNRSDREEVVQETFLRIYNNLHLLDAAKNSSAWIYRIGTNICIDTIRRRKPRYILTSAGVGDPNEIIDREPAPVKTPEQHAIASELNERLMQAIDQLPHKWRPFIYQRYILEMTLEEISVANQMPINTVKSRIHRAIAHLQRVLDDSDLRS
jgi:RNA polymerase sigma-70 factor (ECF subfamily)